MNDFVAGMVTMGFAVAGLFFLRFFARSRDPLFACFGVAFWCLAANQAITALLDAPREDLIWAYLLRLAGFSMIIVGIVSKNARKRPKA